MPGSFLDELRNAIRSGWCAALNTGYNFLDALPDPIVDSGSVPIARANRTLYRMFCNNEPPPPPAPPFTGGQCVGLSYYVRVEGTVTPPTGGTISINEYNVSFQIFGPITGAGITTTPSGGYIAYVDGNNASGLPQRFQLAGGCCWSPAPTCVTTAVTVTTRFGGPDTCGDPPVPVLPPTPGYNTTNINFTYTTNNSIDVDIDASLTFAPSVLNNYGDVTVPIRVSLLSDNTIFGGDINLSTGDITINFGNRNYSPSDRGTPDTYDSPTDTPNVPPDVPVPVTPPSPDDSDSSTTRLLRACIVTVTELDSTAATLIFQDDNPDIFAPNLGYVQFLIAVGNRIAWTTDIPVKNKRHFIPCPWEGGALQVRGTPRAGVTWDISPVYTKQQDVVVFD